MKTATKTLVLPWLILAGCAMDENLSEIASDLDVTNWTDDVKIPGQSTAKQVGLASWGGRIYMVHTGSSDANNLYSSRFNGTSWSDDVMIPNQHAEGGPALTVFENRPTMVYRVAGQNRLAMSTYYGGQWTTPVTVGRSLGTGSIRSAPSITVQTLYGRRRLFIAYCAYSQGRDRLFVDMSASPGWVEYSLDLEGWTCKHPVIAPGTAGSLKLMFNEYNAAWLIHDWILNEANLNPEVGSWAREYPNMSTKKPMSIVACGSHTHLTHGGGGSNPDEIWWTTRGSSGWEPDKRIPNQASNGGATLVCHGDRLIMVHNGGTNQLYWSEYVE